LSVKEDELDNEVMAEEVEGRRPSGRSGSRIENGQSSSSAAPIRKVCWANRSNGSSFTFDRLPFNSVDVLKLLAQHFASLDSSEGNLLAGRLVGAIKQPFERICQEICRLSSALLKCTVNDVSTAVKVC
jgi:hypothetical protein